MTDHLPEDDGGPFLRLLLAGILLLIVVGGAIDLVLDAPRSWLSLHVAFELSLIAAALITAVALWLGWWRARQSVAALHRSLAAQRADRDAWRARAQQALAGLSEAIDAQFREWGLTQAEREVAFMLLKGRSHKEVAGRSDRSERTVRQHAVTVYRKAGVSGRAELAAFFLQDVAPPPDAISGLHSSA